MHARSHPLNRALPVNSRLTSFDADGVLDTEPSFDGCYAAGQLGTIAPPQVLVAPFAEAPPTASFLMRLYAWWNYGAEGPGSGTTWVRFLLAELACTVGPAAAPAQPGLLLRPGEYFADGAELTQGSLGRYGEIVAGDGKVLVLIDLRGARKIQFAFAPDPFRAGALGGNCLWCPASSY